MPLPARLGRTVLAIAAPLALIGPSLQPAAAAPVVEGSVHAFTYFFGSPSAGCTTDATSDSQGPVDYSSAGRLSLGSSTQGTVTQDSDPTQAASASARSVGTHTTVVTAGQVRSVTLGGTLTASLDTNLTAASACSATVQSSLSSSGTITVTRPGWATLRVQLNESEGDGYASVRRNASDLLVTASLAGNRGVATARTFLTPGTYDLLLRLEADRRSATASRAGMLGTVSTSMRSSYAFTPAGAALTPTRGIGALRASLDPAVGCSLGRLGVTWKAPAGKAKVATIKVNGKVLRTVRNPKPGKRVVVKVPLTRPNAVVVTVGGKTATRSYEACR